MLMSPMSCLEVVAVDSKRSQQAAGGLWLAWAWHGGDRLLGRVSVGSPFLFSSHLLFWEVTRAGRGECILKVLWAAWSSICSSAYKGLFHAVSLVALYVSELAAVLKKETSRRAL